MFFRRAARLALRASATELMAAVLPALKAYQPNQRIIVPKIAIVIVTITLMGGWMLNQAMTFGIRCFSAAAIVN